MFGGGGGGGGVVDAAEAEEAVQVSQCLVAYLIPYPGTYLGTSPT